MRTRSLVAVGIALAPLVVGAPFIPSVLAAGPAASSSSPPASSSRPNDPRNQTNISEYMVTCLQGNAKYLSRDFSGAVDTYRRAIQADTKQALGYYLLGEAQLATGNLNEADASWKQASLVVNEPGLQGRILFVIADLRERQKKFQDARLAWQAYSDWSSQYAPAASGDGGVAADSGRAAPSFGAFPSTGAGRIQAIDAAMKQDQAYDKVRRNIAASSDGGLFTLVEGGT
jgi:tetratricopeptide (TPR) repeat protein